MAKSQPTKQRSEAAASVDAPASEELVSGEFAGAPPAHIAADTPAVDPSALANAGAALVVTPIPTGPTLTVRVLVGATVGAQHYSPDTVLENVPVAVAQAYAGVVDPHPDAVAYARSIGAPVVQYQAA